MTYTSWPLRCVDRIRGIIWLISRPRFWALDPGWRTKLIGVKSDGAANMVGSVSDWQARLRNSVADSESFYLMHCGTHQLNLINGKTIVAIGRERSDWLEKLHAIVKWIASKEASKLHRKARFPISVPY
jgi:hypothetical protein